MYKIINNKSNKDLTNIVHGLLKISNHKKSFSQILNKRSKTLIFQMINLLINCFNNIKQILNHILLKIDMIMKMLLINNKSVIILNCLKIMKK